MFSKADCINEKDVDAYWETLCTPAPSRLMNKLLLVLLALGIVTGGVVACPPDDPPAPGGGEGTGKPTAPGKPGK